MPNKKNYTLSLLGIVNNNGIGVNEEGLTKVIPSSFSTQIVEKRKYLFI
jgi:hypothetical protein